MKKTAKIKFFSGFFHLKLPETLEMPFRIAPQKWKVSIALRFWKSNLLQMLNHRVYNWSYE